MMDNYGTPPLALVRGEGAAVWDADGADYLDLVGGIAVNVARPRPPGGRRGGDPAGRHARRTSRNLFVAEPAVALAERLLALLGRDRPGLLLPTPAPRPTRPRSRSRRRDRPRPHVVATEGGFHGRTMGALALTGQPAKRDAVRAAARRRSRFVPVRRRRRRCAAAVTDRTAAGDPRADPGRDRRGPAAGRLSAPRPGRSATPPARCWSLDEVQTGIGRTGHWFAHQAEGVRARRRHPGQGPRRRAAASGACVALRRRRPRCFSPGDHGSTFGGNPVSCAAALAVLDTIERDGLLSHVKRRSGERLRRRRRRRSATRWSAASAGAGCWCGIVLTEPRGRARSRRRRGTPGFLVNAVRPDVVRLAPPLVLTDAEWPSSSTALPGTWTRSARHRIGGGAARDRACTAETARARSAIVDLLGRAAGPLQSELAELLADDG